jgi:hypothetical protein
MKNYKIQKVNNINIKYEYIIFAINDDSPLEYLQDIEKDLAKKNFKGLVLFDLLLSNGDEYNRYVEAYFDGKFFELSSFKGPTLNQEIEHISINFFKKHPEYIDKGVLSSIDIFKMKESFKTFC